MSHDDSSEPGGQECRQKSLEIENLDKGKNEKFDYKHLGNDNLRLFMTCVFRQWKSLEM